jgi:hypothetical protein
VEIRRLADENCTQPIRIKLVSVQCTVQYYTHAGEVAKAAEETGEGGVGGGGGLSGGGDGPWSSTPLGSGLLQSLIHHHAR